MTSSHPPLPPPPPPPRPPPPPPRAKSFANGHTAKLECDWMGVTGGPGVPGSVNAGILWFVWKLVSQYYRLFFTCPSVESYVRNSVAKLGWGHSMNTIGCRKNYAMFNFIPLLCYLVNTTVVGEE